MTCMDAQKQITTFIRGQLDMAKLEEFLAHVNECPICMEELDVYYALLTAMEQLDDDKELSNNYSEDLKLKIKDYEEKIRHAKVNRIRKRFYFLFVMVSFVMISSISFGKSQVSEVELTRPDFQLNYTGIPENKSQVVALFADYDSDLKDYVAKKQMNRVSLYKKSIDYMNKRCYFRKIDYEHQIGNTIE